MAQDRLQKILARAGISSRRAAEQLITSGHVHVNGKPVRELGTRADPERDRIEVDGKPIARERHVYYLIHKPRGIVTTLNDPEGRPSLDELLQDIPERVYPVGRLDFHTSGALLLTNDGDLAQALLHPSHAVPKTYVAKLSREIDDYMLHALQSGVVLDDGYKTQPAHVQHLRDEDGKSWLEITITEGKNRQIHRMVESLDTRVMRLSRLSFAGLSTDGLRPGAIRPLSREEITMLARQYLPREEAQARSIEDRDERALALRGARRGRGESRGSRPSSGRTDPRAGRGSHSTEGRGGPRAHAEDRPAQRGAHAAEDRSRPRAARGANSGDSLSRRGERSTHEVGSRGGQRDEARRGVRKAGGPHRAGERSTHEVSRGGQRDEARGGVRKAGPRSAGERSDSRARVTTSAERSQRGSAQRKGGARMSEPGAAKASHSESGRPRGQNAEGQVRGAGERRANSERSGAQAVKQARTSEKRATGAKAEQGSRSNARSARPNKQKSSAGVDSSKASRHKSRPT